MISVNDSYIFQIMFRSSLLLGLSAGMLGVFMMYKKRVLEINVFSAGSFTGILIVFIITGSHGMWHHFLGALLAGTAAAIMLKIIYKTDMISPYIIQSLMTAVLLGADITLLTYIGQSANAFDSGLNIFLLGESTAIMSDEYAFLKITTIFSIAIMLLLLNRFKTVIFNEDMARAARFRVELYDFLLNAMLITLVSVAINIMGVFLAACIFIIPSVTARLWSVNFSVILAISGLIGAASAATGGVIAGISHSFTSGVSITAVASVIFIVSLIVSPKGLLFRLRRKK